jgi:hypothetical protein
VLCCVQFERACKEVLQDDHQLTAEGEEQHFDDVQVCLTNFERSSQVVARSMHTLHCESQHRQHVRDTGA